MASNGAVGPVMGGPLAQHRLERADALLHHPQLLVLQSHLRRGQVDIGAQNPFSVESGLGTHLVGIDLECACALLQEASVSLVADLGLFQTLDSSLTVERRKWTLNSNLQARKTSVALGLALLR